MSDQNVLGKAKVLTCPKHPKAHVIEAELYYGGFHHYTGFVCRVCAEGYFLETTETSLGKTICALQDNDAYWTIFHSSNLDYKGKQWKALGEGRPVLGLIELSVIGSLGYSCPKCGIVEGMPVASDLTASKEAELSFKGKDVLIKCSKFIRSEEICFEQISEDWRKVLEEAAIYTCKKCKGWIGKSTGKELYW